jgi:hypothetical protein
VTDDSVSIPLTEPEFIHADPGYWQQWAGTPPAEGAAYRVLEDSWSETSGETALRIIHRWEPWSPSMSGRLTRLG